MVFSDAIHVMIMTPSMFKGFCPSERDVVDAKKSVQVLLCMSVEKREDVDRMCEVAGQKGGREDPTELKQMDGMYGRSFEDADGHVSISPPYTRMHYRHDTVVYEGGGEIG